MKARGRMERAYTLIEVLIVLTIIGILFGIGYASYRDFSRRQSLQAAVKGIQGDLRLAQQMALSGNKPDELDCRTYPLDGVHFGMTDSPSYLYRIRAACGPNSVTGWPLIKTVYLPSGITADIHFTPNPILFKVLGQGTNIPNGQETVITLTQTATNNTATITITSGGTIK
jgi:prepilin-type N-terminal cleavage/methylation domain-containing protein